MLNTALGDSKRWGWRHTVVLAASYAMLVWLGVRWAGWVGSGAPIWLASGLGVWAVAVGGGWRALLGVAVGAWLGKWAAHSPMPTWWAGLIGSAGEAFLGAWIYQRVTARWPWIDDGRASQVPAVLLAAFGAPAWSAVWGAGTLGLIGAVRPEDLGEFGLVWWAANALGILIFLPFMEATVRELRSPRPGGRGTRWVWGLSVAAVVAVGAWLVFWLPEGVNRIFLLCPVLLLAAIWHGKAGAQWALLGMVMASLVAVGFGQGGFYADRELEQMLRLYGLLGALAVTALVLPVLREYGQFRLPALVLLLGWTLTWAVYAWTRESEARALEERIVEAAEDGQDALENRMAIYIDALRAGQGLFDAVGDVSWARWQRFAATLQLGRRYPGINGIGVIWPVAADDQERWWQDLQAQGAPKFTIKPVPGVEVPRPRPGEAESYVIGYVSNLSSNRPALGLDVGSEINRRHAANLARDTGAAHMTRRITLVQDGRQRAGFLVFLPVYRGGGTPATAEERRAAFSHWIYAPFITELFMEGVLRGAGRELSVDLFEGRTTDLAARLYAREPESTAPYDYFSEVRLAGLTFTLGWRRSPAFLSPEVNIPVLIGIGLSIVTLLGGGVVTLLQRTSRRAREELSAFQHALDRFVTMSIADSQGRIIYVNDLFRDWWGYPRDTVLGKKFSLLDSGYHPPEFFADLWTTILAGKPWRGTIRNRARDGSLHWADTLIHPEFGETGTDRRFIVLQADLTQSKELEERLARARDEALELSRLKSEFLANISHELRTPMNGIIGMAELLEDSIPDAEQRQMAGIIRSSGEGLMTIVADVLDFAKIEAGKMRIAPAPFEMGPVLRECVALLRVRAAAAGLALLGEGFDLPLGRLEGDEGRIRQVVVNLLGNAIKFTREGSVRLCLTAEMKERMALVRVEIIDTGCGIPVRAQRRLFQPFAQADGSARRAHGGTGLGLAISKQLVELMGGSIGLESEEGKGSRFWFELPLPRVGEALPAPSSPTVAAHSGENVARRLLLVDDNATNREVARIMLTRQGHAVQLAADGETALRMLAGGGFDAVLMDCQMPGLDGFETTRRIRAGTMPGVDAQIPVIAMTAYAGREDRARCLAAGMSDYLAKPVRSVEIAQMLAGLKQVPRRSEGGSSEPTSLGAAGAEPPVLDHDVLAELVAMGGREALRDITEGFFASGEESIKIMETQARSGDWAGLGATAHALGSGGLAFGGRQLRDRARVLEDLTATADAEGCRLAVLRVVVAFEALRRAVDRLPPTVRG